MFFFKCCHKNKKIFPIDNKEILSSRKQVILDTMSGKSVCSSEVNTSIPSKKNTSSKNNSIQISQSDGDITELNSSNKSRSCNDSDIFISKGHPYNFNCKEYDEKNNSIQFSISEDISSHREIQHPIDIDTYIETILDEMGKKFIPKKRHIRNITINYKNNLAIYSYSI